MSNNFEAKWDFESELAVVSGVFSNIEFLSSLEIFMAAQEKEKMAILIDTINMIAQRGNSELKAVVARKV